MSIPLSSPDIDESDIDAVVSVLRSTQLSLGPKLPEFEEAFARYIGVSHGVALSSGTAGLHLSLLALGIGEGDEVVVPSFTFIAAANAIRHARAMPVFADVDPMSLNLTAETIEPVITPRTRAILLVHTFGYPADLEPIIKLAEQHQLRVIEDACEAIGAERGARKIGAFGDLAVFSFYPNKPMTTGEGGVVVTQDPELAGTLRALRNQGRRDGDGWLEHSLLGYNCRLSEMNCALGLSQLTKIEKILAQRQAVAEYYRQALRDSTEVVLPPFTVAAGRVSWFAFVIRLAAGFKRLDRDGVVEALTAAGVGCRAYFPPIHLQPLYEGFRTALPVTEDISARTLALPFFNSLTREQVAVVCQELIAAIRSVRSR
jgi:perosamine synthetase